jgi:heptosyltransferase-1
MPTARILLVKLSSLGDVVHLLPAVSDLRAHRPDAELAWAVEAPYAELAALHPAIARAIPVPLRRLRDRPFSLAAWRGIRVARSALRAQRWDYVVDAQGLLKSACVARWARSTMFGLDKRSAREPIAARFYDARMFVPRAMHAVERNRSLFAQVFGYPLEGAPRYGLVAPSAAPGWAPRGRYAVLLHAASRADKRWADADWIVLAKRLAADGYATVFPGGDDAERGAAERLAGAVGEGALAAPAMSLVEAAALLGHASGVIGVDTGLTHLAVALGIPTVGIYCATDPSLTGLYGELAANLGGRGTPPDVEAVARAAGIGSAAA